MIFAEWPQMGEDTKKQNRTSSSLFPSPISWRVVLLTFDMLPDDLSKLRVVDLREELTKRNLPTKGKKDELVARLQEAVNSEKQNAAATNGEEEKEEEETNPETDVDNQAPGSEQEKEQLPTEKVPEESGPAEPAAAAATSAETENVAPAGEAPKAEEQTQKEESAQNETASIAEERTQEPPAAKAEEKAESLDKTESTETDSERGTKRKREVTEEKPNTGKQWRAQKGSKMDRVLTSPFL